jgi:hypothetical protein
LNRNSSGVNDNRKIRYSQSTLTQPPLVLLNNRRQTYIDLQKDISTEEHKHTKLQIDSEEQYGHIMQLLALHEEITFLSNKLIYTEQKLCKWENKFLELQNDFQELMTEKSKVKEELMTTHRMLQESEHIRARWFIKSSSSIPLTEQGEAVSQKDTSFYRKRYMQD